MTTPRQEKNTKTFSSLRVLRCPLFSRKIEFDFLKNLLRYGLGWASSQSMTRGENSAEGLGKWPPPLMVHSSMAPPGGQVV
jgi:hypothetical protein